MTFHFWIRHSRRSIIHQNYNKKEGGNTLQMVFRLQIKNKQIKAQNLVLNSK